MKNILIIKDYRNAFYSSLDNLKTLCSMDISKIANGLEKNGFNVSVIGYSSVNLEKDYHNTYVLYQSSEDKDLHYKGYIEDIVLSLEKRGAILIPKYEFLRAHHNKVMMETIRKGFKNKDLKTVKTKEYGTLEDTLNEEFDFPVVVKKSEGAGSKGVFLASNKKELVGILKKISFVGNTLDNMKEFYRRITIKGYKYRSLYRKKFIIQNYIPNLDGDYKVLYFRGKYYVIFRENRKNDFRASGSGIIVEPKNDLLPELLDFAEKAAKEIGMPICSLDIAHDGNKFHLIEFQCVTFGPLTLQYSKYYFIKENETWEKVQKTSNLEEEYIRSITEYITIE